MSILRKDQAIHDDNARIGSRPGNERQLRVVRPGDATAIGTALEKIDPAG
jgi:hypothetical protein